MKTIQLGNMTVIGKEKRMSVWMCLLAGIVILGTVGIWSYSLFMMIA